MQFSVVEQTEHWILMALEGRMDASGVNEIEAGFLAQAGATGKPVLLDMAKVAFVASLGMRLLLGAAKTLKRSGGRLVLVSPQPLVQSALLAAGLDQVIPIAASKDEAAKAVGR
ncbi:MAG TPA: STAS domain-containing protein [Candidatus Brocadiia bacterium]|nr:STAS domain-containing protein [Candidatus Brocadiia bacterium]